MVTKDLFTNALEAIEASKESDEITYCAMACRKDLSEASNQIDTYYTDHTTYSGFGWCVVIEWD